MYKFIKIFILVIFCFGLSGCINNSPIITNVKLESIPTKVEYIQYEELDFTGGKIKVEYSDGTSKIFNFTEVEINVGDSTNNLGNSTVTFSITIEETSYNLSYQITVFEDLSREISSVKWDSLPTNIIYNLNDPIKILDGMIEVSYSDGKSEILPISGYNPTIRSGSTSTVGETKVVVAVTVLGQEFLLEYNINVIIETVKISEYGIISWGSLDVELYIDDEKIQLSDDNNRFDLLTYIDLFTKKTYYVKVVTADDVVEDYFDYDPLEINYQEFDSKYSLGTLEEEILDDIEVYVSFNEFLDYPLTDYEISITGFNKDLIGKYTVEITTSNDLFTKSVEIELYSPIIIYDIYGGGGNKGAIYSYDYVVLYNLSSENVSLNGMSIQYISSTSSAPYETGIGALTGTMGANSYYLIRLAKGATVTNVELPAEHNAEFSEINLSATNGKVFLCNQTTPLSSKESLENVLDYVGYGTADQYEGSAAPGLSNTLAIRRKDFVDTNNNGADFIALAPNLSYLSSSQVVLKLLLEGFKDKYQLNHQLDLSELILIIIYDSGATVYEDLTEQMISSFDSDSIGKYSIRVTYEDFTAEFFYDIVEDIIYDYPYLVEDPDNVEITYIDLGKYGMSDTGESALIKMNNLEILVDAGDTHSATYRAISETLDSKVTDGIIEYVIATHSHSDHIGGLSEILYDYQVNTVIRFAPTNYTTEVYSEFVRAYTEQQSDVVFITDILPAGSRTYNYNLSPSVNMNFINTGSLTSSSEPNYTSLVFVLNAFGTKVLFNGDAESSQESIYAPIAGDIDIMKLGHHGAKNATSSSSIAILNPEVVVVTNGNYLGNKFGHPSSHALLNVYNNNLSTKIYALTGGGGTDCNYTYSDNNFVAKAYPSAIPSSSYTSTTGRFYQRNGNITINITIENYVIEASRSSYNGGKLVEIRDTEYWKTVLRAATANLQ